MTFYLKPPRGNLNLHILEECVKERMLCYNYLKNGCLELTHFQYLVEDSSLDRTGHFILRLIASSNNWFEYDFIQNELKLLEVRLTSYDVGDVKLFLRRLLKHTREIISNNANQDLSDIFVILIKVICSMLSNAFLKHIFKTGSSGCCIDCTLLIIEVPFYFCLSMVANREVNLQHGLVQVPCFLWKQLLMCLFLTYLKIVLKYMKCSQYLTYSLEDPRIKGIYKLVKNYTSGNSLTQIDKLSTINVNNIISEAKLFPLCMQNLYKVLERTNRLGHNERFDFSLYLKDIGMTMSDSLKFWKDIYSKEHSKCSKCTHSWQKNEKRYIYGIRHLYGLEGSRKNYPCRSCSYIQERTLGPRDEGGCPFQQFDDDNLRGILKTVLPTNPDEIEVMIYERNENANVACNIFFNTVYNVLTQKCLDKNITFKSPTDYYMQLKKQLAGERSKKNN